MASKEDKDKKKEVHEDYVARKLREKEERELKPVKQEDCGCGD